MENPSSLPILAQILHPSSPAEYVNALRTLKNEIIGNQQRKEAWVGLGVLDSIVRASTSKESRQNGNLGQEPAQEAESLSEEETLRLQALSILGSLAYGKHPLNQISYFITFAKAC
jgi:armadillo repeat-containing protein 8